MQDLEAFIGHDTHTVRDLETLRARIGKPMEYLPHKVSKQIVGTQADFIRQSPFCLLSTTDASGKSPLVSPKGDFPGFVQVLSPTLLAVPERPGNRLVQSLQNIIENPSVQLLFMIPNTAETLRISGHASLSADPDLCCRCGAGGQDAVLVAQFMSSDGKTSW